MKFSFPTCICIAFIFFFQISFSQNYNLTLRSQFTTPNQVSSGIWGYVDSLGNEYALLGAENGMMVINVNNPDSAFEITQVQLNPCKWHEVRTWNGFAYVSSECGNPGIQIIDLRNLHKSATLPVKYFKDTINNSILNTTHALHIEDGYLYLYGSNNINGVIIVSLADPWNPVRVGYYNGDYIHDGCVRNDIIYAGAIYKGYVSFIDVSNKSTPIQIQQQQTPLSFTHNTWLSDDSKTLFATDEKLGSYVVSYDISDISNISELDRFQCTPGSGSIAHNVYINNDYAVTSWYKDGVSIVDAHKPDNLVQIGWYDTHPTLSGDGFQGIWGVYPYLPSGLILACGMDKGDGLYILQPNYTRACYLEGVVTDDICNVPLVDVKITIADSLGIKHTLNNGSYKTGCYLPGNYTITFSKPGYQTKTIQNVTLSAANVVILNTSLSTDSVISLTGKCVDDNNNPISNVTITAINKTIPYTYQFNTNGNGDYSSICNFYIGDYDFTFSKWGYKTVCYSINLGKADTQITTQLQKMYYDDFSTNLGWTIGGNTPNGAWRRAKPAGDIKSDMIDDCGNTAYVAGNITTLINGKYTTITSPEINLENIVSPEITYSRWLYINGLPPHDTLRVSLVDSLNQHYVLEYLVATDTSWKTKTFTIDTVMPASMLKKFRVEFYLTDKNGTNKVEAGIDKFIATGIGVGVEKHTVASKEQLKVYPNPSNGNFTIENTIPKSNIYITDVLGKTITTIQNSGNDNKIQVQQLSKGIYLIYIDNHPEIIPVKLFVY